MKKKLLKRVKKLNKYKMPLLSSKNSRQGIMKNPFPITYKVANFLDMPTYSFLFLSKKQYATSMNRLYAMGGFN